MFILWSSIGSVSAFRRKCQEWKQLCPSDRAQDCFSCWRLARGLVWADKDLLVCRQPEMDASKRRSTARSKRSGPNPLQFQTVKKTSQHTDTDLSRSRTVMQSEGAVRLIPDETLLEGRRHHAVSQLPQVRWLKSAMLRQSQHHCMLLRPLRSRPRVPSRLPARACTMTTHVLLRSLDVRQAYC